MPADGVGAKWITHLTNLFTFAMLGEIRLSPPVHRSRTIRRLLHDGPNLALRDPDAALRRLDQCRVPRGTVPLALTLQVERACEVMDVFPSLLVAWREGHGVTAVDVGQEPPDLLLKCNKVYYAVRKVFLCTGSGEHSLAALFATFVHSQWVRRELHAFQSALLLVFSLLLAIPLPLLSKLRREIVAFVLTTLWGGIK